MDAVAANSVETVVIGRPFPKGVSGNPSGRPKRDAELMAVCRDLTQEAVETLVGVMRKEKAMSSAKVAAAKIILAYGWGAPRETVDLGVTGELAQLMELIAGRTRGLPPTIDVTPG